MSTGSSTQSGKRKDASTGWKLGSQLLAGAFSGITTKTCVAPLERVKILMQVQSMLADKQANKINPAELKYGKNMFTAFRTIITDEGLLRLWKGNGANCLRVVPVYALKFSFNDTFREMVAEDGQTTGDLSKMQLMTAGTMAGAAQITITYPLELVRSRLTLSDGFGKQYSGIAATFGSVLRDEGVLAFYKGFDMTLFSGSLYVGLQMSAYEILTRELTDDGHLAWCNYGPWGKLTAGAGAGLFAQTATYWGDTLRRRMQTNGAGGSEKLYNNSWDCAKTILRKEGVVGLYRGITTNIVRCIPGAAIQFAAYDFFKSAFMNVGSPT